RRPGAFPSAPSHQRGSRMLAQPSPPRHGIPERELHSVTHDIRVVVRVASLVTGGRSGVPSRCLETLFALAENAGMRQSQQMTDFVDSRDLFQRKSRCDWHDLLLV